MKKYRTKALVLSLWCLLGAVTASAQVQTATLEYWMDNRFAERTSLPVNGQTEQDVDVSGLCPGIHTLEMRVSDNQGRWGAPLIRHFLKSDTRLEDNGLGNYEYSIDGDWNNSVQGSLAGEQIISLDISALCPGIHTLQMHITDKQGRQSQTLLRHFLVFGEDVTKRTLTAFRYWVDDFRQMKEGTTSDGQVTLDIDISQLSKGIHTLCYQVSDNTGRWSASRLCHFLIPDLEEGSDRLVAYEYWFNQGPRQRVEFSPTASIDENALLIETKDVEPLCITDDYVFHTAEEMVSLKGDVFFGMQVFNGAGNGSLAIVSDTVEIDMTIDPHVSELGDGDSIAFFAPHGGKMKGWKTICQTSDSLTYRLTPAGVKADFYDGEGRKLASTKSTDEYGNDIYGVKPDGETCYLLVYDASPVVKDMSISLDVISRDESGIARLDGNLQVSARKQQLTIRSTESAHVQICSVAGTVIFNGVISSGISIFRVPSGVCVVSLEGGQTMKVLIP